MPRLLVLVAIAGWASFNLRLWSTIESAFPTGLATRVEVFRGLGWLVGAVAGGGAAARIWMGVTGPVDSTRMALRRGMLAGAGGGALSWFLGLILIGIGHDADGQLPAVAVILAGAGAACNFPAGAGLGVLWWWARPRGRRNEFLR